MHIIDIILEHNEEFINKMVNAIFVGFALECYVCLGQRTNKDKCIKTTIQCEQEQDACKTQIRWQRKYFYILCQAYLISVSITFLDRIPLEKFQLL